MHETSLASRVIAAALEEARPRCLDRVQGIHYARQVFALATPALCMRLRRERMPMT